MKWNCEKGDGGEFYTVKTLTSSFSGNYSVSQLDLIYMPFFSTLFFSKHDYWGKEHHSYHGIYMFSCVLQASSLKRQGAAMGPEIGQ